MGPRITDSLDFHGKALALRAERQRLLASNIANADTPGYQARDIDFKSALAGAGAAAGGAMPLAASAKGHMGGTAATATPGAAAVYALPSQPSADGNTVDMDRERASFADNAIRFEATLRFMNGDIRTMLAAIQGQ